MAAGFDGAGAGAGAAALDAGDGDGDACGCTVGYESAGFGAGGGTPSDDGPRTQNGIWTDQKLTALSPPPVASSRPSGENATALTISSDAL